MSSLTPTVISDSHSISNFLTRSCFDKYLKDARKRPQASPMLMRLIDSVMAIGYDALVKSAQSFVDPEKKKKADYYCQLALNSRCSVLRAPDSLLKVQASLPTVLLCSLC